MSKHSTPVQKCCSFHLLHDEIWICHSLCREWKSFFFILEFECESREPHHCEKLGRNIRTLRPVLNPEWAAEPLDNCYQTSSDLFTCKLSALIPATESLQLTLRTSFRLCLLVIQRPRAAAGPDVHSRRTDVALTLLCSELLFEKCHFLAGPLSLPRRCFFVSVCAVSTMYRNRNPAVTSGVVSALETIPGGSVTWTWCLLH